MTSQALSREVEKLRKQRKKEPSERKRLKKTFRPSEKQLRAANEELTAANQQLEADKAELQATNQRLQSLIDGLSATGIGIDIVDANYKVHYQNSTLKNTFGDLKGRVCHREYMDRTTPCDPCPIKAAIESRSVKTAELTAPNKRNYKLFSVPLPNPNGTTDKAIEVVLDITEQKQAEQNYKSSERKFRSIVEEAASVILIFSPEFEILEFNPEAERVYAISKNQALGKNYLEAFVPEPEREAIAQKMDKVLKGRPIHGFENTILTRSGQEKTLVWNVNALHDDNGKTYGIVASGHDITKRKKAARELRNNFYPMFDEHDEVRALAVYARDITEDRRAKESLLKTQEKLHRLTGQFSVIEEQEKQKFSSFFHDTVSQELALLRLRLGNLKSGLPLEKSWDIDEMRKSLGELIKNVREFILDISPPGLYQLGLEAAVEWLGERLSKAHKCRFHFHKTRTSKPIVKEHIPLAFRLIRELFINIIKHSSARSFGIDISKKGNFAVFLIKDDGVGFESVKVTTKDFGFGLFSIMERLEYIGGSLTMDSSPGKGSRSTLKIPLQRVSRRVT